MKKAISIILVVILTASCMGVASSGAGYGTLPVMDQAQWDTYFASVSNGVGLCELTPGSDISAMNFSWHTSAQIEPVVYIADNSLMENAVEFTGTSKSTQEGAFANRVSATGLEQNTLYYYTYGVAGSVSTPESFQTGDEHDFTFLYMGDVHVSDGTEEGNTLSGTSMTWSNTLSKILNANGQIDFAVSVGDQASAGLGTEMAGFYAAVPLRNLPIATVIGNHEKKAFEFGYYGNRPNEFKGMGTSFIGGDNWFTYGDVLFLTIDSTNGSGIDHYDFVSDAVEKNPDARWRICLLHHDLYGGAYSEADSDNQLIAKVLNPIFEDFDIDFVLQGHSHYYGRTHGLVNGGIVEDYTDAAEITDPSGTVFMVSGSVNRYHYDTYPATPSKVIVKNCVVNDILYTTINVKDDSVCIETRTLSDHAVVDSLTVTKTEENTFDDVNAPSIVTVFIGFAGTLYAVFDKIIKLIRSINIEL